MTAAEQDDATAEIAGIDARLSDLHVVGGEALVRRMLQRFQQHLVLALDEGSPAWTPAFAHRTAGLAGMLGFERLAIACHAVELGALDDGALVADAIVAAEGAVLHLIERLSRAH